MITRIHVAKSSEEKTFNVYIWNCVSLGTGIFQLGG